MTANGWIQILFFFGTLLAVTVPLGAFMYRVLEGESHFLRRPLGWLERLVYRVCGVDGHEQSWPGYAVGLLAFSAFTMLVTYAIQRLQHVLPFNPRGSARSRPAPPSTPRPASRPTPTGRATWARPR